MSGRATLSAPGAFAALQKPGTRIVDVRSEKEFAKGHFAGCHNHPILNDQHRHIVGLTYKKSGQQAAIAVGHELVDPIKPDLVRRWREDLEASTAEPIVMCWRGGLRSEITSQWLAESGYPVKRVEGGYKALRQLALEQIEKPPRLLVLAGYTGSRKTDLLARTRRSIDLEALARHRGSSFGRHLGAQQPAQQTFENNLALAFAAQNASAPVLVEDESVNLGRCFFPKQLGAALMAAEVIWLEVPLSERVASIYEDYVATPLAHGANSADLCRFYLEALTRIRAKIGSQLAAQIAGDMQTAFATDPQIDAHSAWISPLVEVYYDKRYSAACARLARREVFRGDLAAVENYLQREGFLP